MSKNTTKKNNKKIISVDITDFYDDIKRLSTEDIRTVEEEVRYLIKRGIGLSPYRYEYVNHVYPNYIINTNHTTDNRGYDVFDHATSNTMRPINESDSTITVTSMDSDGVFSAN